MATLDQIKLPASIKILAVSKLQSTQKIIDLYNQGQRLFGENYVQEALPKMKELQAYDIQWHFIGNLQSNKAKLVVGHFDLIQSVDSLKLARTISQIAVAKQIQQKILLQVNIASEDTKGGFAENELLPAIQEIVQLPGLKLIGLMTMPPLFEDPEKARPYFKKMSQIKNNLKTKWPQITELSMGTSADYQIAANEGSTLVRLGTMLFGERLQKK